MRTWPVLLLAALPGLASAFLAPGSRSISGCSAAKKGACDWVYVCFHPISTLSKHPGPSKRPIMLQLVQKPIENKQEILARSWFTVPFFLKHPPTFPPRTTAVRSQQHHRRTAPLAVAARDGDVVTADLQVLYMCSFSRRTASPRFQSTIDTK